MPGISCYSFMFSPLLLFSFLSLRFSILISALGSRVESSSAGSSTAARSFITLIARSFGAARVCACICVDCTLYSSLFRRLFSTASRSNGCRLSVECLPAKQSRLSSRKKEIMPAFNGEEGCGENTTSSARCKCYICTFLFTFQGYLAN